MNFKQFEREGNIFGPRKIHGMHLIGILYIMFIKGTIFNLIASNDESLSVNEMELQNFEEIENIRSAFGTNDGARNIDIAKEYRKEEILLFLNICNHRYETQRGFSIEEVSHLLDLKNIFKPRRVLLTTFYYNLIQMETIRAAITTHGFDVIMNFPIEKLSERKFPDALIMLSRIAVLLNIYVSYKDTGTAIEILVEPSSSQNTNDDVNYNGKPFHLVFNVATFNRLDINEETCAENEDTKYPQNNDEYNTLKEFFITVIHLFTYKKLELIDSQGITTIEPIYLTSLIFNGDIEELIIGRNLNVIGILSGLGTEKSKKIKNLKIRGSIHNEISYDDMQKIRDIECLLLKDCYLSYSRDRFTPYTIWIYFFSYYPIVRRLEIDNVNICSEDLVRIFRCNCIKELTVKNKSNKILNDAFNSHEVALNYSKLRSLKIYTECNSNTLEKFSDCRELNEVAFGLTEESSPASEFLEKSHLYRTLESMEIFNLILYEDNSDLISKYKKIRTLKLHCSSIQTENLSFLKGMKSELREFTLLLLSSDTSTENQFTNDFFGEITELRLLEKLVLNVKNAPLTNSFGESARGLKKLESLRIENLRILGDRIFVGLDALQELHVASPVDDGGNLLKALESSTFHKTLITLHFKSMPNCGTIVPWLSKLEKVTKITLLDCGINDTTAKLLLTYNNILNNVEYLDLSKNKISNESFLTCLSCKKLKILKVKGCDLRKTLNIEKFKQINIKIEYIELTGEYLEVHNFLQTILKKMSSLRRIRVKQYFNQIQIKQILDNSRNCAYKGSIFFELELGYDYLVFVGNLDMLEVYQNEFLVRKYDKHEGKRSERDLKIRKEILKDELNKLHDSINDKAKKRTERKRKNIYFEESSEIDDNTCYPSADDLEAIKIGQSRTFDWDRNYHEPGFRSREFNIPRRQAENTSGSVLIIIFIIIIIIVIIKRRRS